MSRDPIRVADLADDASYERRFMREVIRAEERTALPSAAKMDELATRLGPIVTPRATGPLGAPGRWLGATALAGALVVAFVAARSSGTTGMALGSGGTAPPSVVHDDVAPEPSASDDAVPPAPAAPAIQATPSVAVESLPAADGPVRPRAPAVVGSTRAGCTDEIDLMERANAALRAGDHGTALAATREHVARCPDGAFVQERERIAIEALARLGRTDEASARADAFERRYPSSPHLRRIRSLVSRGAAERTP